MASLEEMLKSLGGKSDSDEDPFLHGLKSLVEENPLDLGSDRTDFYKQAAAYLTQMLKGSDDPSLLYYLGQCNLRSGSKQSAIRNFNRLTKKDPDNPLGYLGRGFYYAEGDKHEKAEAEFDKAKELDPDNWHCHIGLGECYFVQDKFEEAEAAFKKAKDLHPINTVTSDLYLHDCYIKQGKYDEAIGMCENIANQHINGMMELILFKITLDKKIGKYIAAMKSIVKKK